MKLFDFFSVFAQMQEAYSANNEAQEEDGEQLWIAEFWSDNVENIMFSPPSKKHKKEFRDADHAPDSYRIEFFRRRNYDALWLNLLNQFY